MGVNIMSFRARYLIEDGHVGPSSPQYFNIEEEDIEEDMTEEKLMGLFSELMQEDFVQSVYPIIDCEEDFLEWCKEILRKRNETTS